MGVSPEAIIGIMIITIDFTIAHVVIIIITRRAYFRDLFSSKCSYFK